MDVVDIMNRLRTGDSIDDIAREMTDALNEAQKEYEAEVAAEKARQMKELEDSLKCSDAAQICVLLDKFIKKYYPEVESREITTEEFIDVCDAVATLFGAAKKIEQKIAPVVEKAESGEFNDAIEDFLNKFVR